jgi:hypothetical protein
MCWNFNGSVANEFTLKPLCEQVDRYFDLPAKSYYRYFAVPNDGIDDRACTSSIVAYLRVLITKICFSSGTVHALIPLAAQSRMLMKLNTWSRSSAFQNS